MDDISQRLTLVPPDDLAQDRNLSRNDAISKILCVTCSPIVALTAGLAEVEIHRLVPALHFGNTAHAPKDVGCHGFMRRQRAPSLNPRSDLKGPTPSGERVPAW